MSSLITAPEMMTVAATDLATIGSDLSIAHLAAAVPTVALAPAAADEVSAVSLICSPATPRTFKGWPQKRRRFTRTLRST